MVPANDYSKSGATSEEPYSTGDRDARPANCNHNGYSRVRMGYNRNTGNPLNIRNHDDFEPRRVARLLR